MMPFEHKSEPLLPRPLFWLRVIWHAFLSFMLIGISLGFGMLGYHYLNQLSWLDSLVNSSMILTGMGPVDHLVSDSAKYFASCYAIFSGIVFLSTVALLLAPVAHRVLHKLHLDDVKRADD
jgi:hypothetical protein